MQFHLKILGQPETKGRHRHGGGRVFTDKRTQLAELDIRRAWEDIGGPHLSGALHLKVELAVVRPQSHYRKNGELNKEGLRHPFPENRKPDLDNALKLVMDALGKGRAWRDDVMIVSATVERYWAREAHTRVHAEEKEAPRGGLLATASLSSPRTPVPTA